MKSFVKSISHHYRPCFIKGEFTADRSEKGGDEKSLQRSKCSLQAVHERQVVLLAASPIEIVISLAFCDMCLLIRMRIVL